MKLLTDLIPNYTPFNKTAEDHLDPFLSFIEQHGTKAFERVHDTGGHIVATACIVTPDFKKVIMMEHAKLGHWLFPGGHCDGNPDVISGALREAEEEVGIKRDDVQLYSKMPLIDMDIHTIPERGGVKAEPEHKHYNVTLLFVAHEELELTGNEESTNLGWVNVCEIPALRPDGGRFRVRETLTLMQKELEELER